MKDSWIHQRHKQHPQKKDAKSKGNCIKFNKQHSEVQIEIGDNALIKEIKPNKPSATFSPYPMGVVQMHVSQVMQIIMKKYLVEISAFSKRWTVLLQSNMMWKQCPHQQTSRFFIPNSVTKAEAQNWPKIKQLLRNCPG